MRKISLTEIKKQFKKARVENSLEEGTLLKTESTGGPYYSGMSTVLLKAKDILSRSSYLWAILAFAFLSRIHGIGNIGVSGREISGIERIFTLNKASNFFNYDISSNLYYLLQNLWGKLFGYTLTNMRILTVIISIFGLYIFCMFTEEWFNRKLAYIATFVLSISSFHILVSRGINHEILYMVVVLLSLHLLTLAYRQKKKLYFVLSGIFLGLSFYSSEITFVFLLLFVLAGAYFYFINRKFLTSFLEEKVLVVVSALVIAAPYFYRLFTNPSFLFSKFTLDPGTLVENGRMFFSSILFYPVRDNMYTVGTDKIFDPFVLLTFLLGFGYIILKFRRRKFFFLLAWFFLLSLMVISKKEFSLGDFTYLLPIIFIMSARVQTYVLDKWFKTFPFNKFARVAMILGIGFLFFLTVNYNYMKVFLAWDKSPERILSYNKAVIKAPKGGSIYIYKSSITPETASVIFGEKGKIERIDGLNVDFRDSAVVTQNTEISFVKNQRKDVKWTEYKGNKIVLLKGE